MFIDNNISIIVLYSDINKDYLNAVITSVFSQSITPKEIIIVDNSKNGLNGFNEKCKIVRTGFTNRSKARNIGAKASIGSVLVFLDGDTLMGSRLILEEIKRYCNKYSYGYGAKRMWTYPQGFFEKNKEKYISRLSKKDFIWVINNSFWPKESNKFAGFDDLTRYSFPGNFGFISKELFDKIEGFDERFEGYGGEDDHFAYKLYMADKCKFVNLFSLSVVHINHLKKDTDYIESLKNNRLFQKILKHEGIKSFNINVLFKAPNFKGEEVIEWQK